MQVIDLTHPLSSDMPVFPGDKNPRIKDLTTLEKEMCRTKWLELASHTGTHVDAPYHILQNGESLDKLPLTSFYGNGVKIDITGLLDEPVSLDELKERWPKTNTKTDFVLFQSGHSKHWGEQQYLKEYPVLSISAIQWLLEQDIKGFGVDLISIDPIDSMGSINHKLILKAKACIFENLTNLEALPDSGFIFSAFPLSFKKADGSPVRAVGIIK